MNRTRVRAWIGTIVFLFVAPGIVAGLIPYAITQYRIPWQPPAIVPVAIVAGLAILAGVIVVVGPYRFVRNPMEKLTSLDRVTELARQPLQLASQ